MPNVKKSQQLSGIIMLDYYSLLLYSIYMESKTMIKEKKYKAVVIESELGGVAVKFPSGRIVFCQRVSHPSKILTFENGTDGWAEYSSCGNGYLWYFTPFKKHWKEQ